MEDPPLITPSDTQPGTVNPGRLRIWLATILCKTYFLANLLIFEIILRMVSPLGKRTLLRVSSFQCRLLHGVVPLAFGELRIEGAQHLDPRRRFIVVLNHQSYLESILPLSVLAPIDPVFICKKELGYGIPAISYTLRTAGHCLIDRNDREQALGAIEEVAGRAATGEVSPVLFPEGTRSPDGQLLPFKPGGFKTLLEKTPGIPILPVLIDGGRHLFHKKQLWVRPGSRVHMRILPPLERTEGDDDTLIVRVESLMHGELDAMRAC